MIKVKGFEGYYVDEDGEFYSQRTKGGKLCSDLKRMKQEVTSKNYRRVTFSIGNEQKRFQSHRLIAIAFHGDQPEEKPIVRHLNGDPSDNRSCNLRWGTYKENEQDKKEHGRVSNGSKNGNSKLNESQVVLIKKMLEEGISCIKIGREFNTSKSNILSIKHKKTWAHIDA